MNKPPEPRWSHDGHGGLRLTGGIIPEGRPFRRSLEWGRQHIVELHERRASYLATFKFHILLPFYDNVIGSLERAIEDAEWCLAHAQEVAA